MVNEKCRDAVTDLFIILDSRDISRIGTVLKNPLEMGAVAEVHPWHLSLFKEEIVYQQFMMMECLSSSGYRR